MDSFGAFDPLTLCGECLATALGYAPSMICSIAVACSLATAKPVAVMVHGAGGGGWEYKFWKPVFEAAGYRVVAPDLIPLKGGHVKTTVDDYLKKSQGGRAPQ